MSKRNRSFRDCEVTRHRLVYRALTGTGTRPLQASIIAMCNPADGRRAVAHTTAPSLRAQRSNPEASVRAVPGLLRRFAPRNEDEAKRSRDDGHRLGRIS